MHVHLPEHAWEEDLGVHLLTELDCSVGHEYLHALVVEASALTVVNHEYCRDTEVRCDSVSYLISDSGVLHLLHGVHELDPVDPTPACGRLYADLRYVVGVSLHLLVDCFPE